MITKQKLVAPLMVAAALVGGVGAGYASMAAADTSTTSSGTAQVTTTGPMGMIKEMMGRHGGKPPGVMGTVSFINGTTITLMGKDGKTYTVDAASTSIEKIQTITVANITTGDTLMVNGTVSGTAVTALHIMDGQPPMMDHGGGPRGTKGDDDGETDDDATKTSK